MDTRNLIGYEYLPRLGKQFNAANPALNVDLPGEFYAASMSEADTALNLADKAFKVYRYIDRNKKAAFLRCIADNMKALSNEIVERAMSESGLPEQRLQGELTRTTNQLYMFADLLEEGSWVE